ncbi:MAG: hypothetical protein J7K81_07835 [Methanophagales archaeon]|nr:hypothetical protein [Methanophagales archaeon]
MILFLLTDEDAQILAKERIGRELSYDELERVKKGLEFGLECWEEVMITAIEEVADEG